MQLFRRQLNEVELLTSRENGVQDLAPGFLEGPYQHSRTKGCAWIRARRGTRFGGEDTRRGTPESSSRGSPKTC